jgi:DNA-binding LytR/AlgR family response regulator
MGYRVLIVEDEYIISDTLNALLTDNGHTVTGEAIDFTEATEMFCADPPDIVLLDIRLSGRKSGIDVAKFIRSQPAAVPFIYLTAQLDDRYLSLAKETFPAGYLGKPVPMDSLLAMIDVAMHNHRAVQREPTITIRSGTATHVLPFSAIEHVQADHVYVQINLKGQQPLIVRYPLRQIAEELTTSNFMRVHRSHIINVEAVTRYDLNRVFIGENIVPIGGKYREAVTTCLAQRYGSST